jgi:hypothetical protein
MLIRNLFKLFLFSFLAGVIVMSYYANFYLGESFLLQKIYFGLFYLSFLTLFIALILKIIKKFKTK